jgi:PTS system nitrogen regulatory IIA component
MAIADLLQPERLLLDSSAASKKRALEHLSELLATADESLAAGKVFDSLLVRERLGSTGLGYGVAIPHARHIGAREAIGAFVRLSQPADFDAIDAERVDLVFGLLVPEECTDEHVQLLAELAELFSNPVVREKLRRATTAADVIAIIRDGATAAV